MKKVINTWYVEDYGILAYQCETGEILMPVGYNGRLITQEEFEKDSSNSPEAKRIIDAFEHIQYLLTYGI